MRLPLPGRLRHIRVDLLSLTQEQLAKKIRVSRFTPIRWEQGRSAPDEENAGKLARLSGYPVEALLPEPEMNWVARELAALRDEIRPPGSPSRHEIGKELARQLEQQALILRKVVGALDELRALVADLREERAEARQAKPRRPRASGGNAGEDR